MVQATNWPEWENQGEKVDHVPVQFHHFIKCQEVKKDEVKKGLNLEVQKEEDHPEVDQEADHHTEKCQVEEKEPINVNQKKCQEVGKNHIEKKCHLVEEKKKFQ